MARAADTVGNPRRSRRGGCQRNVLEVITEENRRYPDVSLVDLDWAIQLDIPELDKFSDKQLKHPKGTVGVCPQVRELLQKKYRQFEQEPPKMSAVCVAPFIFTHALLGNQRQLQKLESFNLPCFYTLHSVARRADWC